MSDWCCRRLMSRPIHPWTCIRAMFNTKLSLLRRLLAIQWGSKRWRRKGWNSSNKFDIKEMTFLFWTHKQTFGNGPLHSLITCEINFQPYSSRWTDIIDGVLIAFGVIKSACQLNNVTSLDRDGLNWELYLWIGRDLTTCRISTSYMCPVNEICQLHVMSNM